MSAAINVGGAWGDRTGLFVTTGDGQLAVSVRSDRHWFKAAGVFAAVDCDDDTLARALAGLNASIQDWPEPPVTVAMVREAQ